MSNDRSANGVEALGRSTTAAIGEEGALLALEAELDDLVSQLIAAQEADQLLAVSDSARCGTEDVSIKEAQAKRVEAILARLYPIERAIMAAPACTVVGLGVKARHAAYVISQYWQEPAGKIDWEAQVVRLLIEAVCDVARTPL
ncbi:hypothetical protein [Bradyrhizobium sp. McL0615]|uniref:hypothetical protein n=1 Tax=Bradyrhizobium sp. McL0615 TaxID=3415673 RepID=UPI003CF10F17